MDIFRFSRVVIRFPPFIGFIKTDPELNTRSIRHHKPIVAFFTPGPLPPNHNPKKPPDWYDTRQVFLHSIEQGSDAPCFLLLIAGAKPFYARMQLKLRFFFSGYRAKNHIRDGLYYIPKPRLLGIKMGVNKKYPLSCVQEKRQHRGVVACLPGNNLGRGPEEQATFVKVFPNQDIRMVAAILLSENCSKGDPCVLFYSILQRCASR